MTFENLAERMRKDTPPNEDQLRGTCRSCGWSERIAGPLKTEGFCDFCAIVRSAEKDRELRAIMSRRRD